LLLQNSIRYRRNELGLTQVELANKAEFSVGVMKRFKDDKPHNPTGRNFLKLANALEVDPDKLLFDCQWP
jgi:transcriptional regulator with XRE-family HTH domain